MTSPCPNLTIRPIFPQLLVATVMGNNRSANICHGGTAPNSSRKFWKKKSSIKNEPQNGASPQIWMAAENGQETEPSKEQHQKGKGSRRSSLYQQQPASMGHHRTTGGLLKKSRSEKAHEVFGSSDLPLLLDDNNEECGQSVDSSGAMSAGNNHQQQRGAAQRPPAGAAPHHFCSSASTSSRLMHRQTMAAENGAARRRVKSFRHFPSKRSSGGTVLGSTGRGGGAHAHLCPITGLSLIQKRLILNRWRQLGDRIDLFGICSVVFQRVFEAQPQFALAILQPTSKGKRQSAAPLGLLPPDFCTHRPFRLHVERFCQAFYFALIGLEDDNLALLEQMLIEFGAAHASSSFDGGNLASSSSPHIPSEYWEAVRACLCEAGQSQTGKQQQIVNLQRNPLVDSLDRRRPTRGCPLFCSRRSAESWTLFCTFLVSKIRFGYEMERFLRVCYNRAVHRQRETERMKGEEDGGHSSSEGD